jgi:uncharacterized protein with NRDE domain
MCVMALAQVLLVQFPIILIHQREEDYTRETTLPALEEDVYACIDKLGGEASSRISQLIDRVAWLIQRLSGECSGGTWMGFNSLTGAVAALTNVRAKYASLFFGP